MRLLLIEDDVLFGDGLQSYLEADGHVVDWVKQLKHASNFASEPYDAWLLDWNLPDGQGPDWLRAMRRQGHATPTLMLTARDGLSERINGLDSGADDYLVKPFAPEELSARLRALARRQMGGHTTLRFEDTVIDMDQKQAHKGEQRVELTAREWGLLETLMLRKGRIVPRQALENLVMGPEAEVQSNALEVHIFNLRKKLGKGLIETVRGMGYRLTTGSSQP